MWLIVGEGRFLGGDMNAITGQRGSTASQNNRHPITLNLWFTKLCRLKVTHSDVDYLLMIMMVMLITIAIL